MPTTKIKFTYEDYLQMPDDKRYELIEGDFFVAPSPATYHQRISGRLEFLLRKFVQGNNLGEVFNAPFDIVLSEENVFQPDILFISKENSGIITEKNVQGAPDLVIEITSPATEHRDKGVKRKIYAKFGVKEYWIVDSDRRIVEVMVLRETGFESVRIYGEEDFLSSPLLKGFSIDLREVF